MKDLSELTVLCVDYGTFIGLADCMARKVKRCLYYSPWEQEYVNIHRCVIGDGFEHFQRIDDFLHPDVLKEIDIAIFPDICYTGLQEFFKSIGKLVWGSFSATDLELYRTKFLKTIASAGLPVVHYETIRGVTALGEHLKTCEDKWIKINRYRDNMESWHHINYEHSKTELLRLSNEFGPLRERPVFVVQDPINDEDGSPVIEVGYDGWSVDGQYPETSYQGLEAKNELYLGSQLAYDELPEEVRHVNEAMSPILRDIGYRNFIATEIRIKDGIGHFIDPTNRMAGQTMEHLLKTCTNLPEVIYAGAQGNLIKPDFEETHAAEATLHYQHANGALDCQWKTLVVPEEALPWTKLYHCCHADGAYHFPPRKSDEVGVICGNGPDVESALENLKEHFALLEGEPVSIELSGFTKLLEQIEKGEEEEIPFTDGPLPEVEQVVT